MGPAILLEQAMSEARDLGAQVIWCHDPWINIAALAFMDPLFFEYCALGKVGSK